MALDSSVDGVVGARKKGKSHPSPNSAPATELSKRAAKRRRRKGKAKAVDQSSNGSTDIIDLTFDDTSRSSSIHPSSRKAIRREPGEAGPSAGASRSVEVAAFDRIPRPILVGVSLPSPERGHGGQPSARVSEDVEVFVDESPAVEAAGPSSVDRLATSGGPSTSAAMSAQITVLSTTSLPSSSSTVPSAVTTSSRSAGTSLDLLLPENVTLDDLADTSLDSARDSNDMEGLHFLDADTTRGVSRYFDATAAAPTEAEASFLATADQSKICANCKRPGHKRQACPHTLCPVCGAVDSHERRDCPYSLVCFGCGQRGHRQTNCADPKLRNSKKRGCDRCGARDHPENSCPSLWRQYAYCTPEARLAIQKTKRESKDWHREAIGGDEAEEWCYNCAREGHLGDDCPQYRVSGARLYTPSAFSYVMQSRGPFFHPSSGQPPMPKAQHTRFDDDEAPLPFISKGFGGAEAGKKAREKARKAMQSREEGDDPDDWFGRTRSGGAGQRANDRTRDRAPNKGSRFAGPSREVMGRRLPFGHSDLMPSQQSRQPKIAFGKLSLPNGAAPHTPNGMGKKHQGLPSAVSPRSHGKGKNGKSSVNGYHTNNHKAAEKPSPGLGGKAKKRKREEDRDWEMEWQNSGMGGGSVVGWGKDLDREDRAVKKMKGGQGPPTPANRGRGQRGANKAPGQRYTGSY